MHRAPRRLTSRATVAAALCALVLALAACGADDDDAGAAATAAPQQPTATSQAAASGASGAPTTADLDLSDVKLVFGQQGPARGILVDESGVLEGTEYEVEWATFSGPAEVLGALNADALDIAWLGDASLPLTQGNAKPAWTKDNVPYKAVAFSSYVGRETFPGVQIVARKGAGIRTLEDLRGKKIAYNPGGNIEIFAWAAVREAGLTKDDVVPSPFTSAALGLTAILNGQVDAYVGSDVNVAKVVAEGGTVLLGSRDVGLTGGTAYAVPTKRLEDPAKVAALADLFGRLVQFTEWYQDNLPEVKQIYIEKLQQDEATAEINTQTQGPEFLPIDDNLLGYVQWYADLMVDVGLLSATIDTSLGFDPRLNDAVVAATEQYFTHDQSPAVVRPPA